MTEIERLTAIIAGICAYPLCECVGDGCQVLDAPVPETCNRADFEDLARQLPKGMQHCTFVTMQCSKGHTRLTATNWIDHGCAKCEKDRLDLDLVLERARNLTAMSAGKNMMLALKAENVRLTEVLTTIAEACERQDKEPVTATSLRLIRETGRRARQAIK